MTYLVRVDAAETTCRARGCCWHKVDQLGVPWCFRPQSTSASCGIPDIARGDCHPEQGASPTTCAARGCCWMSSSAAGASWCFYPAADKGYTLGNIAETSLGKSVSLSKALSSSSLPFPKPLSKLKIYDPSSQRYEVPIDTPKVLSKASSTFYNYTIVGNPYVGLKVSRKSSSSVVFDSTVAPMTFTDQYMEITVAVPTSNLYGLGERTGSLKLKPEDGPKVTFWARDQPPDPDKNLYGSHPFLLGVESDGKAFGIFLLNSNAMEVGLVKTNPVSVNYKTTGGILDFFVFLGPSPDDVIQQYSEVIGKTMMPPYWSLGFHLCRWGYTNTANLRLIIDDMRKKQIPYDTQWVDIDYMDSYKDWTLDPNNFNDLPNLVNDLHSYGMHFIPIVDPGISNTVGYAPFDDGVNRGIFIKTHDNSSFIVGKVWPGNTVFPDFTHPDAGNYWYTHAKAFHDKVNYDGLWIDMNEPANFVKGSLTGCTTGTNDDPPFVPPITGDMTDKTLCTSAQQHLSSHYNLHSLYGHFEAKATYETLMRIRGKRSLIISRSTFAGSGKYTGHWTGDNHSTWADLIYSISGIINFNMFGIPMVGADICGFAGTVDVELCTRWMQLGSFYPFMRNHRDRDGDGQDPASSLFTSALPIMKKALEQRYRLLPYLYTLFYRSHIDGKPVIRPLFFQFPQDPKTYDIDKQFLWGSGLLISPVLVKGATTVTAYLPAGNWFDIETGVESMGGTHVFDAPPQHNRWSKYNNFIEFKAENARLTSTVVLYDYAVKMTLGSVVIYGVHSRPTIANFNGHHVPFTYDSNAKVLRFQHLNGDLLKSLTFTWS
ncbi:lysosomal alpha-glucosidase [Mytilus galloprovincialis]|uniref:Lysosomal alpha-glucosidase n=1 Tax=Mytilus galloprovincialis TaxID=29158 RepID=A0A8B6GK24_MYTGA|nr:lysosomal alpha-glucosidase [Mytilus galloprovincialis]